MLATTLLLLSLTTPAAADDGAPAASAEAHERRGFKLVTPDVDEARHALVIGNSSYAVSPLNNPTHDAKLVAASLRSVDFDVVELHDLDREGLLRAIRAFGDKLRKGGVGLFYFAGHGVQVDGRSYLVPVDARIRVTSDVTLEAVDAGHVLARMEEAKNRLNLVVLDACRNNPLPKATRTSGGGLAFLQAPTGVLIAYATAPGQVAADGSGTHSVYSEAFAQELRTPGARVEDVFKRVRSRTRRATSGAQVPWESSSLEGDFFFVAKGEHPAPIDLTVAPDSTSNVLGVLQGDAALGGLMAAAVGGDRARVRELEGTWRMYINWAAFAATAGASLALVAFLSGCLGAPFFTRAVLTQLNAPTPSTGDQSLDSLLLLGLFTGQAQLATYVLGYGLCGLAGVTGLAAVALIPVYWWTDNGAIATYEEIRSIDPEWEPNVGEQTQTAQSY